MKYTIWPGSLKSQDGKSALTYDLHVEGRRGPMCTFWNLPGEQGQTSKRMAEAVCQLLNRACLNRRRMKMSTRAVYTFIDEHAKHHVYKHHDGYPIGAAEAIAEALNNAWPLPRFEADEFGAAFIAANKTSNGGIRLTLGPDKHGDLEYRYEVSLGTNNKLRVVAFERTGGWSGPAQYKEIFDGTLLAFTEWAKKKEAEVE